MLKSNLQNNDRLSPISCMSIDDSWVNSSSTFWWAKDNQKRCIQNSKIKNTLSSLLNKMFTNLSLQENSILKSTPEGLKSIVRHIFDKDNWSLIDGTPLVLCVNETTDNLVWNNEHMNVYSRLVGTDLFNTTELKLLTQLTKELRNPIDLCDYAIIKVNIKLEWSYEQIKSLLINPSKHKLFDVNITCVDIWHEFNDYNSVIYKEYKSSKTGLISFTSSFTKLLSKSIELQSSHSELRSCYIIEKSVDSSSSSASLLEYESHILIRLILITELECSQNQLSDSFSSEWLIREFSVMNLNSFLSSVST